MLDLTDGELRQALHVLEDLDLVSPVRDSRVPKWEHRARTVLNLRRDETAVLCLLLLRGPQTPGELRSRADRLYAFDDLLAVTATLDRLAARPPIGEVAAGLGDTGPLTAALPRQPGAREIRYTHLLGNVAAGLPAADPLSSNISTALPDHRSGAREHGAPEQIRAQVEQMHAELEQLRRELAQVHRRLDSLEAKSLPASPLPVA